MDFTLRLYKDVDRSPNLTDLKHITISGITLVSKPGKFDPVCMHKGNQKRHGYSIELSSKFEKVAGSNQYPILWTNEEYVDIKVKNFPRYPAFYQDMYAARSCLQGYGYTNYLNKGFPHQLLYRRIEIIHK